MLIWLILLIGLRWSFKEAVVKASGRKDLIFPDMYLVKGETGKSLFSFNKTSKFDKGKPKIKFLNTNLTIIENELKIADSHVSISHEDEYSIAYVILETLCEEKK